MEVCKRRLLINLTVFLLVTVLAGCSPQVQTGGGKQDGGILRVGSLQEPDYLNPPLSEMLTSAEVSKMIFSGLLQVDDEMNYFADLAKEVPSEENGGIAIEGDGFVVTYHLRDDVKWHDGEPFDAEDVKFTYEMYMNPAVRVFSNDGYDKIENFVVVDPYTVKISFREIYPAFQQLFDYVLPEHILSQSADINTDEFNRNPVGTGPFKFVRWEPGAYIEVAANEEYYGDGPYLDSIIYKIVPDVNTLLTQLKTGEVDAFFNFNWAQLEEIEKTTGVSAYITPAMFWEHVDFNLRRPLFQDKAVRQAVFTAIDRQQIVDMLMYGRVEIATGDQAPISWAYNSNVKQYRKDTAEARALLEGAGWTLGTDGIYEKDGQKLSFTISTTAGDVQREQIEQLMKEQLREAGINLEIRNYDALTLFGDIIENGKFDTVLFAWMAGVDPDNFTLWHSDQLPPNGQNYPHFINARVDELIEASRQTFDQTARKECFDEIQEILAEEVPVMPLYYRANLDVAVSKLHEFKPNPTSYSNMWNCSQWWLEQ